jgi:hypothetical protein
MESALIKGKKMVERRVDESIFVNKNDRVLVDQKTRKIYYGEEITTQLEGYGESFLWQNDSDRRKKARRIKSGGNVSRL